MMPFILLEMDRVSQLKFYFLDLTIKKHGHFKTWNMILSISLKMERIYFMDKTLFFGYDNIQNVTSFKIWKDILLDL